MGRTMGMDLNVRRNRGVPGFSLSRLAWVPIPVVLAAMAVFRAADWQYSRPSVHLLLIVNIVFTLLVCLVVAYLITQSFRIRSTPGLLLLGCAVALWGPAGVVALRERVELLGGRMKIRSFKDRGTAVRIVVPHGAEDGKQKTHER